MTDHEHAVRDDVARALNEDTPVLERYVKVKWVLPAFLIILVTAVAVVALFWQRGNDKDEFRADQVALLTYLVANQAADRCEASVDSRAAIRILVQALVERGNPSQEELEEFMAFVDSVYIQPDPSKCPARPDLPEFSGQPLPGISIPVSTAP